MKLKWLRSSSMFMVMILAASIAVIATFERPSTGKKAKNTPEAILQAERNQKIQRRAAGYAKQDRPDKFMQMHREIRTREGDNGPRYKPNYKIDAMKRAGILDVSGKTLTPRTRLSKTSTVSWVERGPANFSGRARGLIVDPADSTGKTWFVGSVGGGVWKTSDAGLTYTDKTPNLPALATTVLAMAESNHDIIYLGTGEGFGNADAIQGDGIFKSDDHGETWTQLSATAANEDFFYVNRIVVDPANDEIVIAATNTGIFKSTNGGSSWSEVYTSSSAVQHIIADFTDFDIQYATVNGFGVIKSTDAGNTWASSKTGIGAGARFEIAMAPSNHNRLYLAVQVGGSGSDLYTSTDAGANWILVNDASGTNPNWLGAQGWYDNTIAIDPYNDTTLFVGGINLWKIVLAPGSSTAIQRTADTIGTGSFLAFVNFGLPFLGGGVGTGHQFFAPLLPPTNLTANDTTFDIEIRFGPGISQKAHRFLFSANFAYRYQDYVEVPFQVWDVTNNRQLMASFRDRDSNGVWDLFTYTGDPNNVPRDYLIVNAVPYNALAADPNIGVNSGEVYKCVMAVGPSLKSGATWTPDALPTSKLTFTYRSVTTGFRNTTQVTNWYPGLTRPSGGTYPWTHADNHNIVMIPKGSENYHILIANDAGVAYSTDKGDTWIYDEETPDGMNSTQFYGVDKKPGALAFIGGTQDNGTWRSPVNASDTARWIEQLGGDGFDAVWKGDDGNQLIGSLYDNRLYKSTDGGLTWNTATNGLLDVNNSNSYFVTQIASSKLDPDLIFTIGGSGVWRSDNFGDSWTLAPLTQANFGFSALINFVAISEADPQVVWAGTRMSASGKVNLSTDGGLTFAPTVNYGTSLGALSGLTTHPTEKNTAYAMFSFAGYPKILRTTNLGQTWTDITGFSGSGPSSNGFPDVATYCMLVNPNNTNELWAGTDIGLFISTDNGGTWAYANNGLPAVAIWEMKVVDDQIVVATHGRGVWTTQITTPTLPSVTLAPRLSGAAQSPSTGNVTMSVSLRSAYDSTLIKAGVNTVLTLGATSVIDTALALSAVTPGNITFQVVSYKNGTAYKSSSVTLNVIQALTPQTKYGNNFNAATTDFSGSLFTITQPTGFSNGALHSAHPYLDNTNNTYQLNVPIVVSADSCMLVFDEIALVEKGEPGTVFGDAEFWDYAIVEGTSDGINWVYLSDGWDARLHADWLTAYDAGSTPTSAMFKKHQINIKSTFNTGEVIFIRFRLFADAATTGWGWAVDNVTVNPDRVPPQITLGALASPVVNTVRFAVGANEKLSTATVSVNSQGVTMTKQGDLYFGNYSITGSGVLSVVANGRDSSNNFGTQIIRNYSVSPLSKSSEFENYKLTGSGDGYWVLGKSTLMNVPPSWKVIGSPIDVAATGSASGFTAEFNYSDVETLKNEYADFSENKIGIYENINGEWKHAGGEGGNGSVTAKFKGNQLAVFYNPDYEYIPKDFKLTQNYPNPFNPSTTIRYEIPKSSKVVIKVYNMLGQEVRTLVNGNKDRGSYEIVWNGKNEFGNQVSSGVYLYRLEAGNVVKTRKMLFIK